MALASILQLILIFGLENIVLVQRSPYPVLNLSLPSFSRKKPPPPLLCSPNPSPASQSASHSRKPGFGWLGVVRGELGVPLGGLFVVQILLIPGSAGSL